jgi:CHAT domain-containing protein/Flp pilus assembly protein TadD
MRPPLILILLFLLPLICFGQDWQTTYQASVDAYKSQNFSEAIAKAENAVALSKDLDAKSKAFSIQIFTASCIEGNSPDQGLKYCDQEIELFQVIEPNGKNHMEAIRKKGNLLVLSGSHANAASTFHDLALRYDKIGGRTFSYFRSLADEGDSYLQAKMFTEARKAYSQCLEGLKNNPEQSEDYLYTLFNTSYVDFQLKEFASAGKSLGEFIKLIEDNDLKTLPEYEQARKMLSTINSQSGNPSGPSNFLTAEDELKKILSSALAAQQTNVSEALALYSSGGKIIGEKSISNNTSFSILVNHARLLYAVHQYGPAGETLEKAKKQAAVLFQPESAEMGSLDILEADLLMWHDKTADASVLYKRAMTRIAKLDIKILSKQVRWIAEQLLKAGLAPSAMEAIQTLQQTPAFKTLDVPEIILVEKLFSNASIESRQTANLIERLKMKLSNETNVALKQGYLLLLAQAETESANYSVALTYINQALALPNADMLNAELQLELARIHQHLGNYKEAEVAFGSAVERSASSPYAAMLKPQVYNSFATFYLQLGNYVSAERLFRKLLDEQKADQLLFFNAVRQNFASMYQQIGKYAEAKKLLIETVHSDQKLLGDKHPDFAIGLQNLAAVYQRLGLRDSALVLYQQALEIDRSFYGDKSLSYASKLANLGALYQDQGEFEKALKLYSEALDIRKLKLHAEHPDYNYNLFTIGYLFYRTHQTDKALPYLQQSAGFYLRQIREVFPVLSDYERAAFFNKIKEIIDGYGMFMVESVGKNPSLAGELLNFRLETKALLLNASLKVRNQILQSGNAQLINKFSVWQHTKEQLAYLYSLSLEEQKGNAALLAEYKDKANELEKWLSLKSEAFASSIVVPASDWTKIQKILKPGEAAIEIIRTRLPNDSVVYAAVILKSGTSQPHMVALSDGKTLEEKAFKLYINSIRFQLEDKKSYDAFWKKIDASLQDVTMVYLSPDGVFNKLNPLTFFNPEKNEYVFDRIQIELTSNLKELVANSSAAGGPSGQRALLLGFPDYRLNSQLQAKDVKSQDGTTNLFFQVIKSGVTDLLGTLHEISEIREALESKNWKVASYIRDQAGEEKMKAVKNPDIIHIATHGFFIASTKAKSQQVHGTDMSNIDNNVMLRSGLLLAGAEKNLLERMLGNTSPGSDDGVLTAYEIMNLNLDSTRLVVLSACETAMGDIQNGEGVYGLQRAFLLAGADAVIMSLWKVDDEATRHLMSQFYKTWTGEKDRSRAFYNTQREIRKQFPHPFYWGAFVVTGDL